MSQKPLPSPRPASHVQACLARTAPPQLTRLPGGGGARPLPAPALPAVPVRTPGPAAPRAGVLQGFFPGGLSRLPASGAIQPRSNDPSTAVQPAAAATLLRTTAPALRLPPVVQAQMERLFGTSFSDVRVHVGPQASAIGALAFTLGSELYFANGQYEPHSPAGQRLLAHELTHVVQQRAGRVRNPFGAGLAVVQDAGLEAEAERMGIRASAVQPARVRLPEPPPRPAAGQSPATVQRSSAAPDPFARAMTRGHQEELKDQAEFGMDLESVVHGKRLSKPVKKFLKPKYDTREDVHGTAGDYSVSRAGNYVDFSAYAIVSTTISYTGTRTDDFKAADSKVSVVRSAATQVWHHVEDYDDDTNVGTMQLLLRDLHDRVRHYGGVHIYKQGKRYTAGEYGGKDDDP